MWTRDALEQGWWRWQWQVGWVVMVMQARRLAHEGREARAVGQEQAGLVAQVRALVSVLVLERAQVSEGGLAQVLLEVEAQEVAVQGTVLRAVGLELAVVALQVQVLERLQVVARARVQALESELVLVQALV